MKYITTLEEDSDIILNGDRCITNLKDLYTALVLKDTEEIVMTREFVDKYFTLNGLQTFVENAQTINDHCNIIVDEVLPLFQSNMVEELNDLKDREELLHALQFRDKDVMDAIHMLCDYYLNSVQENVAANNKVATLHIMNSQLERKFKDRDEDYKNLMEVKNNYEMKLKSLVARINYNYKKDVESNKLVQITGHRYDKILYIKEITRIHYTDTLIYYLQESLKIMYGVPCRLVVIEPFYAYSHCKLYPNCKPAYDLTKQDVYQSDIVMAGFQPKLLEDIIHNPAHMNYLIILDRGGYAVPHVYGKNIELVYEVSSPDDLEALGIVCDSDHVITYNDNTLTIPYVENFQFMSIEEKMRIYSSMPIMKKLIELIETR